MFEVNKKYLIKGTKRIRRNVGYRIYWIKYNQYLKRKKKKVNSKIKISIVVPVYKTNKRHLIELIESIINQTYINWELCISSSENSKTINNILVNFSKSDPRIKFITSKETYGISDNTNRALSLVSGDYITFVDHDDILSNNAIKEVYIAIKKMNPDIIYSDEDKIKGKNNHHCDAFFKPDFNLDLLRSMNYICHLLTIKRKMLDYVGKFRKEYDGAQDYDFILRCVEKTNRIYHIPKILYHWRIHSSSVAGNVACKKYAYESGKRALEAHFKRLNINADVEYHKIPGRYRVIYSNKENSLISIIIPNKDNIVLLSKCIDSILHKTCYNNYEIIIIENNSIMKSTFEYYKKISKNNRIRILKWKGKFNYSKINNFAAVYAKGKYLLFLNNDTEVITSNWLELMLSNCEREEVGAVGVKLYYYDGTIQHAGVVIGQGGVAGHSFVRTVDADDTYFNFANVQRNVSAVTAACMMVKRQIFFEVGGFEEQLAIAFNDIDLCLKIIDKGKNIVYIPSVELYHYESKTRGKEDSKEKQLRFRNEIRWMKRKWKRFLSKGDPNYNINLGLNNCNYFIL